MFQRQMGRMKNEHGITMLNEKMNFTKIGGVANDVPLLLLTVLFTVFTVPFVGTLSVFFKNESLKPKYFEGFETRATHRVALCKYHFR